MLIRLRDAQAGLRLCCLQTPEDRFSRDEAQLTTPDSKQVLDFVGCYVAAYWHMFTRQEIQNLIHIK